MAGRHTETHDHVDAAAGEPTQRAAVTSLIDTNADSGPITVPRPRLLGDTGLAAHPLGLNAASFHANLDPDAAAAVLDRFAALGGTLIDTSDSAAGERSAATVGRWMASRGTRERMIVTTRVGRHPERTGLAPATLRRAVDDALDRLGTDRLEVLYLHGEDRTVPLEETLGAIGALVDAGKVGALGAADFSPEALIQARVLAANGLPRIRLVTTRYNLMERTRFEGAPELVAHAQGLGVLAHSALARGFLAGRTLRRGTLQHEPRGAWSAWQIGRRGHRVLAAIDQVASARDAPPAAVAIAWLLSRATVVAPVVGVSRPEQLDPLLAAAALELHRSELVELDRASA